jgi:hypothetical protein
MYRRDRLARNGRRLLDGVISGQRACPL